MTFWENAIFEAIDKILTLNGRSVDLTLSPDSWIATHTKEFLETSFDWNLLNKDSVGISVEPPLQISVKTFDLAEKLGLPFSFFASYAWGKDLIPLFNKESLSAEGLSVVQNILKVHGLDGNLPERHPIL